MGRTTENAFTKMPEDTNQKSLEELREMWWEAFDLLDQGQYKPALLYFNLMLGEPALPDTQRGGVLTGVAEAKFLLGNTNEGIETNIRSLAFFPGRKNTYQRLLNMIYSRRKLRYAPHVYYLLCKNFRHIYAEELRLQEEKKALNESRPDNTN